MGLVFLPLRREESKLKVGVGTYVGGDLHSVKRPTRGAEQVVLAVQKAN